MQHFICLRHSIDCSFLHINNVKIPRMHVCQRLSSSGENGQCQKCWSKSRVFAGDALLNTDRIEFCILGLWSNNKMCSPVCEYIQFFFFYMKIILWYGDCMHMNILSVGTSSIIINLRDIHIFYPFMPWIGVYHGEMDVIQWTWYFFSYHVQAD